MRCDILHGFLGTPSEWDFFKEARCWNLFLEESIQRDSLVSWGKWFAEENSSNLLMGYSLGGRLALHALLEAPDKWKGAVILSAHPGLPSLMERKMRLEQDRAWAKRWLTDSWKDVVGDWNRQSVFKHDLKPNFIETDFDRRHLFKAMTNWSLGHQEDLRGKIAKLDVPILWIAGEFDSKFRKIAESVTLSHPKSKFWIAPQVGHRIHLGQQQNLVNRIKEFEESV